MANKKAFYLTIEGGDGSGKTTLVQNLVNYFNQQKISLLLTKEFGSDLDKFCAEARKLALSSEYNLDEIAGQILFSAIVRQHQEKVIKPNLKSGYEVILSDRGPDSNYAYGPAHGLSEKQIKDIFKMGYYQAIKPDLTIYLDISPELSAKRRSRRAGEEFKNNAVDRVEQKGDELQNQVRKNFLKIAKSDSARFKVIKITEDKTPEQTLKEVISILIKAKVLPEEK